MRAAMVLAMVGVLLVGACGDGENDASDPGASTTDERTGESLLIRTSLTIAADEGAEPIATGEVLEGSTLGGSAFCVGGTILDSHGSSDPDVALIARTITCPEGRLRIDVTPELAPGPTRTGSWTIVSGTGAYEGLSGRGEREVTLDPDEDAPARETYTGTVTR
jgi:hypothetical protein